MGINRPTNLNIRDVPGNGSIVGLSTSPSVVCTTTVCQVCYNSVGACVDYSLGSQYVTLCACPCCDIVCGCNCTICDRTVPSGMWKTSEQYEAKGRDAWGDDSCSTGATTCLCNINSGRTCCTCTTFTGGYVICKASNVAWIVAPSSTEVSRDWFSRNDAVTTAQSVSGCTGWFVPTCGQLQNPGSTCKTYWDSWSGTYYWSSTESDIHGGGRAWSVWFPTGVAGGHRPQSSTVCVRAFRCVTY